MKLNKTQKIISTVLLSFLLLTTLTMKDDLPILVYFAVLIASAYCLYRINRKAQSEDIKEATPTAQTPQLEANAIAANKVETGILSPADAAKAKKNKKIVTIVAILIGLAAIGHMLDDGTGKVSVSPFDHSVDVVERYIKKSYLRDPGSYESIHWDKVYQNSNGTYSVTHSFRAKNGFGGMGQETLTFTIAADGRTVLGHN